jgi:hypothetical protein
MKDLISMNLIKISLQLTQDQIFAARENRNWEMFDELDEMGKLRHILEELEIYEDILDPEFEPDLSRRY